MAGDSSAAGVGARTQREALAYPLAALLARRLGGAVRWQLVAESGLTSEGVLQRLVRTRPQTADIAVIVVGVNDITKDVPLAFALRQRQHIADWLHIHAGVRHVVFPALPEMENFPAVPKPLAWYAGQAARRNNRAQARWAARLPGSRTWSWMASRVPTCSAKTDFIRRPRCMRGWPNTLPITSSRSRRDRGAQAHHGETMNLKGKTIFISGASRGIGLAIVKRAAADGANVAIAAKTVEPNPRLPGTIHRAAAEIEAAGGKALAIQCDIREEEQVVAAAKKAAETFGGIDILVNNASAINLTPTEATPMKRFDLMFGVNVRGTFLCTQACLPYLKKAGERKRNPHILTLSPPLNMERTLVRAPCGVHDGEVRHEHVRARTCRGVPQLRHRCQRTMATYGDPDGGAADDPWRAARALPLAGDHGRCRLCRC